MNKAELIKRCEELGINTEPLTNNAQREAAIEAKEAELAETNNVQDIEVLEAEVLTTNNGDQAFEIDDVAYTFSKRFPKSGRLQVDGVVYTKKQLLNNQDVLETLVDSPFIKLL